MRLDNLSLLDAQRLAVELGAVVEMKRATGHLSFSHALVPKVMLVHGERRDASRKLVSWLRRVREAVEAFRAFLEVVPGPSSPSSSAPLAGATTAKTAA